MEIEIDKKTLPKEDGQRVKFQIVRDEMKGRLDKWHEGHYSAKSEGIYTLRGKFYSVEFDVVRWEALPDGHLMQKDAERKSAPKDTLVFSKEFLFIIRKE